MARVYLGDAKGRGGADLEAMTKIYLGAQTNPGRGGMGKDNVAMTTSTQIKRMRLLLSYHYYAEDDLGRIAGLFEEAGIELDMFGDSGAFSAFTQGKTIDAKEYTAWVKRWRKHLSVVAGPDVIGNAEQTKVDTLRMRDEIGASLPVLPCFHVNDDWDHLDFWCNQEKAEYIALGGMVPYTKRTKLLASWLNKAFSIIPQTTHVHGFGLTVWQLLLRYPWFSVDSSSWTAGFRYGEFAVFDSKQGKFIKMTMSDRDRLLKCAPLLQRYGVRPTEATSKGYDRDLLVVASIRSWQAAEEWLLDFKTKRGTRALSTYFVTVDGKNAPNNPEVMLQSVEKHNAKNP